MPPDLEAHLKTSGAVLWEDFTKTAVNKFDLKSIMSQSLGFLDTGLAVLPSVEDLYVTGNIEDTNKFSGSSQLDLT
jgi:hypothetical protein